MVWLFTEYTRQQHYLIHLSSPAELHYFTPSCDICRCMYSVSQKSPLGFSNIFFQNSWEFLVNILYTYCTFLLPVTKLCHIKHDHLVQTICSKCPPLAETHAGIFWHFPQTVRNFWTKFYTPITRSYVRQITNFYPIIFNCDEVMPY